MGDLEVWKQPLEGNSHSDEVVIASAETKKNERPMAHLTLHLAVECEGFEKSRAAITGLRAWNTARS